MAAANAWAAGHSAVPPSQLLPASSNPQEILHLSKNVLWISLPSKYRLSRSKKSLSCRCSNNFENTDYRDGGSNYSRSLSSACSSSSSSSAEWDWNRWTRNFSEVEQAARYASVLKVQTFTCISSFRCLFNIPRFVNFIFWVGKKRVCWYCS